MGKLLKGFGLIVAATACSSGSSICSCPAGWTKHSGPDGFFCSIFEATKSTYTDAKESCINMNGTFPLIDSDEDLAYFNEILEKKTWIQAEYKGLKGSKRWKDWNNKKLKNISWYDSINDSQDEPTKGDIYAYLKPKDSTI